VQTPRQEGPQRPEPGSKQLKVALELVAAISSVAFQLSLISICLKESETFIRFLTLIYCRHQFSL
jgi:hypothetical protein